MSASSKVILIVVIVLLLLFVFVMQAGISVSLVDGAEDHWENGVPIRFDTRGSG
jgi:hypothetical protein